MSSTKDLIKKALEKNEHVYIPTGRTTWRLPTDIPSLDKILGGGVPGGSIVQLYGPEKSGKTTLAYRIAGKAIEAGYETLLIPIEKYSEQYAEACGIDIDSPLFHVVAADFAELTFNICIDAIRNYDTKVIVMDSISAATPKADLEKKQKTNDLEKGMNIATQSRAIGDFIRKIQQPIRRKEALFVTVNQMSHQISTWGAPLKPKGGEQLQYFSDIKIRMKGKDNKADKMIVTTLTVDKGKDWDMIPFGTTDLYVYHAKGIDSIRDVFEQAKLGKIITRSGAWFSYGDIRVQGVDAFIDILKDKPEIREEIMSQIMDADIEVMIDVPEEEKTEEGSGSDE